MIIYRGEKWEKRKMESQGGRKSGIEEIDTQTQSSTVNDQTQEWPNPSSLPAGQFCILLPCSCDSECSGMFTCMGVL